jgi:signal transduction histidine kinase
MRHIFLRGSSRFLAPLVLGAVLIGMVLHMLNFGGRRESLAARAESAFIRGALVFHGMMASKSLGEWPIVTISAADDDRPAIRLSSHGTLMDASIEEYASVLERVAASHPQWIVISWLTYAHSLSPEHLKPLTAVIDRLGIRDRVTIAVNLYASETIPADFMRAYHIVEARDCYYEVNLFCTVAPDWEWMPQQVMNRFMRPKSAWVISKNLPHVLPNILLNVPEVSHLTHYQFLDFRPPVMAHIPDGAVVFIGNDMSQEFGFRDNKDALQKTYTAMSKASTTLMKDGVPWHVFWAQMAAMFAENRYIAVLPQWIGWSVIVVLISGVVVGMRMSRRWTLWSLFAVGLSVVLLNLVTVPLMQLYVPVMPLAMAVVVLFIGATFSSVAYSSYSKWRLQAAADLAESTADIKQNFIHLISHNLNTPIAQLRGILEILASDHPGEQSLGDAMQVLEWMRVTVRSVLNTVTMAHQSLRVEEIGFRAMMGDFQEQENGFFKRLGIDLVLRPAESDEDLGEIWFYRFKLDLEMARMCLLYATCIIILKCRSSKITINCMPLNDEPADPKGLSLSIIAESSNSLNLNIAADFAIAAMLRFLAMAESRGTVTVSQEDLRLTLVF